MRKLYVFDTTLRDGEQSLGITLNVKEKLEIGHQLVKLGVDIIEASAKAYINALDKRDLHIGLETD